MRTSGGRLLAVRLSDDHVAPNALVALDPETGRETPYFFFDLPAEAELMTMTEYDDVVVENGRLFFGAKKAEGPAAGQPKRTHLVLGVQSSAAKK
ncbi:hypothetical protein BM536_009385 [Streptomyces phaeoluteigriseus]|uniref:Uncharacterized protein n=1 Tax=Streptomyces phaeoluteigriseus TaxID=114686 RepID=A0A1V6MVP1_9ACTN|nr:hypothetical protein [Streptomyces phaeoluteigriseus]OQD56442.1 hypothetical protein BM536_009385 [Streptomyces phaeoluteigriseus]